MGRLAGGANLRSFMVGVLAVLAVLYTLYIARSVLMPFAVALLLAFVLMPVVRFMSRHLRAPHSVSAGVLLTILVLATAAAVYRLGGPAMTWVRQLPESFEQVERRMHVIREPVQEIQRAAEEVEEAASMQSEPAM